MLFVYSGDVPELNTVLHSALKPAHTLTTIPFSLDDLAAARHDTEYFRHLGFNAQTLSRATYQDPVSLRQSIMVSDAIYLMGGNTYEFLAYSMQVGLFDILAAYEKNGGIIVSESAGSIILSPDISTAAIPSSYPDHNDIKLAQLEGMGRIPFHISPHFDPKSIHMEQDLRELQALADSSNIPVYVLEDGEGFIMKGETIVRVCGNRRILEPNVLDGRMPSDVFSVSSGTSSLYT